MLVGLWPEDDVNHLNHLHTISLQKRNPGFDKDQRLLTLHDFMGTPALPNQPISHNNFISIFNKSFFCDQGWLLAINYPGPHI